MRVLVAGGAGYIGSHVSRALIDSGYEVTVYDNLSTGCRENLFDDADFYQGDILDKEALAGCMGKGFDCLIHLAAFKAAGESMENPGKFSENNISGSINILNQALENKINNIVFSSSAAVYGTPGYLPVDEEHPKSPDNYYGFTKLIIENLLEWYGKLKGINYAALRYFNAAGYDSEGRVKGLERKPENLLPIVMETAVGKRKNLKIFGEDYSTRDGTCIRDYIHVNDLADAHVSALHYISSKKSNLVLNLGTQNGLTVKEIIDASRKITGRDIPAVASERRKGDPESLVASYKKAKNILGWIPRRSGIDSIISSTWNVYNENYNL